MNAVYEKGESADLRLLFILALLAMITAVLSVYAVLRQVFSERKNNLRLLYRIGMSKRQIIKMLSFECACFMVIQALIGIAVGVAAYFAIYGYQVNVLGLLDFSAFISDDFVKAKTPNPFVLAAVLGSAVLAFSYVLGVIQAFNKSEKIKKSRKATARLGGCFRRIFAQKAVTIVQISALSIMIYAAMLGYVYYTDSGKSEPVKRVYTEKITYEIAGGSLDMESDNIAKYYSSSIPSFIGINSYNSLPQTFITADPLFNGGIDDKTAQKLGGATAAGLLQQTILFLSRRRINLKIKLSSPRKTSATFFCRTRKTNLKAFLTRVASAQRLSTAVKQK